MLGEDPRRQVDPPRAVARDTLGRGTCDLVGHERAAAGDHEHGGDGRDEPDRPVAGDHRDEHRDAEERDEARLRVGEEEAGEQERDDARRERDPDLPVPRRREHDRDPEHDVAAVEARVAEQRRDPEEARVRVADLHGGRVEDQPVRGLLDEADGAKSAASETAAIPSARGIQAGNGDRATTATSTTKASRKYWSRFCAAASAARPENRERGEGDERGEREGDLAQAAPAQS